MLKLPLFRDLTEMERSTLSPRSRKLFTLSALYTATRALLARMEDRNAEDRREVATAFWDEAAKLFPEWQQVLEQKLSAAEVRRDLLHTHGVVLQALGRAGNALLREQPQAWKKSLKKLSRLDWSRSNAKLWEGRALVGGRVSKASTHVTLTTNIIKAHLGLPLTPEEQRIEDAFLRGEHAAR